MHVHGAILLPSIHTSANRPRDMLTAFLATVVVLALLAFGVGRRRALAVAGDRWSNLRSLPGHYGFYVSIWATFPALVIAALWSFVGPQLWADGAPAGVGPEIVGMSLALGLGCGGLVFARGHIRPTFPAREAVERFVRALLFASSGLAILTTVGIVMSLLFEALRFFQLVSPAEFFFGLQWSPQTAMRADQVGASGAFGAVPVFAGTLLITLVAMSVSVPIGLLSAIYLGEYAGDRTRAVVKPLLEILAGVPTVVYGFFAALSVAPFIRGIGESLGLDVASESALAAGLVMGVMIIPFISSLSDDAIAAVPRAMREGSLALGATRSETVRLVILPAALPGIVGAILMAVSRAIGETMIVVMAAGLAANLTANPLAAVTTVTAQIVTLLVGDQEFDSAKTLAAFALGLTLLVLTLGINLIALATVRRYREQYE